MSILSKNWNITINLLVETISHFQTWYVSLIYCTTSKASILSWMDGLEPWIGIVFFYCVKKKTWWPNEGLEKWTYKKNKGILSKQKVMFMHVCTCLTSVINDVWYSNFNVIWKMSNLPLWHVLLHVSHHNFNQQILI